MEQINTNAMIWGFFWSASMKAAVHLGKDVEGNLLVTKNTDFSEIKLLLSITQKFIRDQENVFCGVSKIDWDHMDEKYLVA